MPETHHYTLDVDNRPDVLPRVVTTVRRRGGEIVAMRYASGDQHRPGSMEMTVRAPRPLACWLEGLIDVRAVHVG